MKIWTRNLRMNRQNWKSKYQGYVYIYIYIGLHQLNKAFEMTNYHISNEQHTTRINTRLEELNDGARGVLSEAVPVSAIRCFQL